MLDVMEPQTGINELMRRGAILEAAAQDKALQRDLMTYAAKNPNWWISTFVWTFDPRLKIPLQPMVLYDYQEEIPLIWLGEEGYVRADGSLWPLLIDKSRDMGITWCIVAAVAFGLIFRDVTYGLMTRNGSELDSHTTQSLFGKLDHIFKHLPSWMIDHVELAKGRTRKPHQFSYKGSSVEGSLTTEDAFRQQRHTRTFVDEAPVIPKLAALLTSIKDVTPAPCLVGTPKGKNAFYRMVDGREFKVISNKIKLDVANREEIGWLHRRYHYSIHPNKTPGTKVGDSWFRREKAERSELAWAQEQEISYDQTAEGRIWPGFGAAHIYSLEEWTTRRAGDAETAEEEVLAHSRIVAAWDFGTGHHSPTCCLVAAIYKDPDKDDPYEVFILDYHSWLRTPADKVAKDFYNYLGKWGVTKHYGDISGKNKESDQRSWHENLLPHGIRITESTTKGFGREIRDKILHMIQADQLWLTPEACICDKGHPGPGVDDVMYQYRAGSDGKPKKDEYSHLADCLMYIILKEIMKTRSTTTEEASHA